jgi:phosphohistidine phosphatase
MLVFLVRHAHSDLGEPDELRPLSTRGHGEARALGERLSGHATPPQVVLSSPLLRAVQTAEAIGLATEATLQVDERLAPGATVEDLRAAVGGLTGPVAAVCHQPDCSEMALALTGSDPGFPPAGVAEVTVDD